MPTGDQLAERFYPEFAMGGFTRVDGSLAFYSRIAALLRPTDHVLDYGAGRGAQIDTMKPGYIRELKIFKGRVAHVEGCDVDPVVLENPFLDSARVIDPAKPLPYDDASFDLIHSNWVWEHVDDPAMVARELLRVLKPGGHICAITPNKFGYVAIAARLVGNGRHVSLLKAIQPERKDVDVFPTRCRLNTPGTIRRYFGGKADVVVYSGSSEPSYHFNNAVVYRLFKLFHNISPQWLNTALLVFIRKHAP